MSRLASPFLFALALMAAGCVVEATEPPGTSDNAAGEADASANTGGDDPDAGPGGGGDADPTGGGDAGPTAMSVLTDFGDCMRLADWEAAGLGQLALVETEASGNCATCHSNGLSNNYLNADSTLTFNNIKTYPYVIRYAEVDSQLALSVSDDLVLQGQVAGHPTFTLPAELEQGLSDFFDATNVHYVAGDCPDPGL